MTPAKRETLARREISAMQQRMAALRFYASEASWRITWNEAPPALRDGGKLAREALGLETSDDNGNGERT